MEKWSNTRARLAAAFDLDLAQIQQDASRLAAIVDEKTQTRIRGGEATSYSSDSNALLPPLEGGTLADLLPPARSSPLHIEANLEDAARLLATAQDVKDKYESAARDFLDAKVRIDEFMRLDDVHKLEITAGLYSTPATDAADELAGVGAAVAQLKDARDRIAQMLSSTGAFGATAKGNALGWSGQLMMPPPQGPPNGDVVAAHLAEYRINLDAQGWQHALSTTQAQLDQLEGRLGALARRAEFLNLDESFKVSRVEISRDIAHLQLGEHDRDGSPVNHRERMTQLSDRYVRTLKRLVGRMAAVSDGAGHAYGLQLPLPTPAPGRFLDGIAAWLDEAADTVLAARRSEQLEVHSLWFSSDEIRGGKAVEFVAPTVALGRARLRGLAVEFLGDRDRPLAVQITPPSTALGSQPPPVLRYDRVLRVGVASDITPRHRDGLWNANPGEAWTIQAVSGDLTDVTEVVLHLWVAR